MESAVSVEWAVAVRGRRIPRIIRGKMERASSRCPVSITGPDEVKAHLPFRHRPMGPSEANVPWNEDQ
jgi:hypothetical protein